MNMKKLVVASHNAGKIREIKSMLEPFQVEVVSAAELDLPDVEETGSTFVYVKVRYKMCVLNEKMT